MNSSRHSRSHSNTHRIWGGRFSTKPSELMNHINASVAIDQRLALEDITASIAHCTMLAKQKIITNEEARAIENGLISIREDILKGRFEWRAELEDVHMNIEAALAERIGKIAGCLHTARSRNDQVATDFRLWVRQQSHDIITLLTQLQQSLLAQIEKNGELILPGMTHLQNAQAILLGHHFLAYIEKFGRDRLRLVSTIERLNECPLGAAALAGTPYPIDRTLTASLLQFDAPMSNALDAVSDRDFALDFLSAVAICGIHLSSLAEEIVLWHSPAFAFVRLDDEWTTGSSIMPQKRNPDAAELIRGKTGALCGAFQSLLITLKALPLAYNKDLQEDKEPVFCAADQLTLCLQVMAQMIDHCHFNKDAMRAAAEQGYTTATDAADWLVHHHKIPFREAHHIVGRMVKVAEDNGIQLHELKPEQRASISPLLDDKLLASLSVECSIGSKNSLGGTAPSQVKAGVTRARKKWQLA